MLIDKYIGFDIDCNETVACVDEKGKKERFTTLRTDIDRMEGILWPLDRRIQCCNIVSRKRIF